MNSLQLGFVDKRVLRSDAACPINPKPMTYRINQQNQKEEDMSTTENHFYLSVEQTSNHCPIGEIVGKKNMAEGKIPVFSCEGACIRGEIARQAANFVAQEDPYRRGCHGELLTVPASAIAKWAVSADKVVLIDGCFLRCHGRAMEGLIDKEKLIQFDALSHYKRYNDIFDMDEVPEAERNQVARSVADWVLEALNGSFQGCLSTAQKEPGGSCCS